MTDVRRTPLVRIVDDDADLREALLFMLEQEGIDAEAHPDARSFLAADMPSQPGVLVLDVRMPGMSGPELHAELERRRYSHPIIFLTAHADVELAVETLRLGAFHFLQKPVVPEKFVAAVTEALAEDARRSSGAPEARDAEALLSTLTGREREVIELVLRGFLNACIAVDLGLSIRTIEAHRAAAYRKLGVRSLTELKHLLG